MRARKTVTIKLDEPILGHNEVINEVVLQEPSYRDYMLLGSPVTVVELRGGNTTYSENDEAIERYIECCLVRPKDPLILNQGGLHLAIALRKAVIDFFRKGDPETATSTISPTTSSGDAEKDGSQPAM